MKPRRFWQSLWIPVLLLAVILALGACGERRGAETPTPTSPPRIPEATVSPTVSEPPASQEVTASPEVSPSPEATASPTELPPTPSPSPSRTPTPEDPAFGELTFSRILQPSGVLGPQGLLFPPGTERVYASAAYRNMRPDLRFEERW